MKLLHHYCTIITNRFQLLHIPMKLLSIHYYLLLHYYYAITIILLHHYYAITTPLLLKSLLHITTILLHHYYAITTHYYKILFHYYIITTSSLLASVTTHYYQVQLLPNPYYYVLLPLLPLLRITYRGNLEMLVLAFGAAGQESAWLFGQHSLWQTPGPACRRPTQGRALQQLGRPVTAMGRPGVCTASALLLETIGNGGGI
jgi:hypothetical protein